MARTWAAFAAAAAAVSVQGQTLSLTQRIEALEASQVVELHGSGTTNPKKYLWEAMSLFQDRAKMPLFMTYRAVGSGTGQYEFLGETNPAGAYTPYNHFGAGDIPMSEDNFAKLTTASAAMVHVPFAMSAIAIFHSVPASANGGADIKLTGCVLAKIFSRQIKTWDHAEIKALNPSFLVPANTNIKVVHRVHGSSSTAGTTEYLKKACPASWTLAVGKEITWPTDTFDAQGSGGMASFLETEEYAIGYLDAGHGQSLGLGEIALENKNGKSLTSSQADIAAAGAAAIASSVIPSQPDANWKDVNLYDLAGDTTWPITVFSYFYIRKDLSTMAPKTGALLKAFVEFSMSTEGGEVLKKYGFSQVPAQVKTYNEETLSSKMTWPTGMPTIGVELGSTTQKGAGAGTYMISGKRRGFGEYSLSTLSKDMTELSSKATHVVQVHGSGTTNPSKLIWEAMDLFEERARQPMHMTYRAVGSGTGQYEFVGETNPKGAFHPYNDFGSGDIPMSQDYYNKLTAQSAAMVHIPFAMSAIAIFHSVPANANGGAAVKLTGCVLAKIFSRQIKTWDHAEIKALNPSLSVPADTNIKVVHRVLGSSSTAGTTEYLKKACPAGWNLDVGKLVNWPEDTFEAQGSGGMASFIETEEYAIGYLDAGHGHSLGFQEIALENKNGKSVTSATADIGAAGGVALSGSSSVIPSDPSADWSAVNLYDLEGDTTWPITVFSYFYVRKDLSAMDAHTAGALKAFIEFMLSAEGQAMAGDFLFTPVPQAVIDYNMNTMKTITFPAAMPTMAFETAKSTQKGGGAGAYMISGKRRSYAEVERESMAKKIAALEAKLAAQSSAAGSADDSGSDSSSVTSIVALVVAILALLASSVFMCLTMRATRSVRSAKFDDFDTNEPSASAIGSPTAA